MSDEQELDELECRLRSGDSADAIASLRSELATAKAEIERLNGGHEIEVSLLIQERECAEEALTQAYFVVTERHPEWSSGFGPADALEDMDVTLIQERAEIERLTKERDDYATGKREGWARVNVLESEVIDTVEMLATAIARADAAEAGLREKDSEIGTLNIVLATRGDVIRSMLDGRCYACGPLLCISMIHGTIARSNRRPVDDPTSSPLRPSPLPAGSRQPAPGTAHGAG